jgi:hypothetical protein
MKPLKRLFVPTPQEMIGYTTIAFVLLCLSNLPTIFHLLIGNEEQTSLQPIFDTYASNLTATVNNFRPLATFSTGLFWAVVGAAVYGLIWTGWNIYLEVHNDIEIGSHFLNPAAQTHAQFWYHKIGTVLFQVGIGVLIARFVLLSIKQLYPLTVIRFRAFSLNWSQPKNWLYTLGALLGLSAVLYVYAVLLRLMLRRTRVFS